MYETKPGQTAAFKSHLPINNYYREIFSFNIKTLISSEVIFVKKKISVYLLTCIKIRFLEPFSPGRGHVLLLERGPGVTL